MGLLDRLFNRPLSQDSFAKMVIKRLRASGEAGTIDYDPKQFRLSKSKDRVLFLHNVYQQYQRLPKSEHENLIRSFLTTWHTIGMEAPKDFDDVKADLLPALRARAYLEIDVHRISDTFRSDVVIPFEVIGEHLAVSLVYDLPQSMMSVDSKLLDQWGVSFYEAMEVAKQNLHENTRQFAKAGDLYAVVSGDSYDASRLVLKDFIQSMEVSGDKIAMVPNREALYICGSEDAAGLAMMAHLTKENFQHERNISGMAYRLASDEWETWLPSEDHPSYQAFRELHVQSLAQTYAEQKDLFDKRHEREKTDIFVATYSAMQNKAGRIASYCMWSDEVDSLLPKTDQIFFFCPHAPKDKQLAARGDWNRVQSIVGDLMEPQDTYPERWRVREFPSEAMLGKIGMMSQ
jgi:Protein of unknown function (DUF1444)